jgi:hypothetical protein
MSNRDDELEDELPESIESPYDVANFRRIPSRRTAQDVMFTRGLCVECGCMREVIGFDPDT